MTSTAAPHSNASARGRFIKRLADDFGSILIVATVVLATAYLVVPVIMAIMMSFDARTFLGPFPPSRLSWQWYDKLFGDRHYLVGLENSLMVASTAALSSIVVGVPAAIALDRFNFPGKGALSAFFLSPLVIPGVVIGFSLLMFLANLSVYDGVTRLLLGHMLIGVPYTIRTTLASLVGIRPSLSEAALTLGANERQAFFDVTFPLAKTGIVAGAIFAFAFSFDDVSMSMFLSDTHTYTLPIALISGMRANFDLTTAAAAVLLVAFTAGLVLLLDRAVGIDRVFGVGIYSR
jgi:putative spermidine/putrescine transport system permease protein